MSQADRERARYLRGLLDAKEQGTQGIYVDQAEVREAERRAGIFPRGLISQLWKDLMSRRGNDSSDSFSANTPGKNETRNKRPAKKARLAGEFKPKP